MTPKINWYKNALGFAAMICGGLALLLSLIPGIGLVAWAIAPVAIILGIISLRNDQRGTSIAGICMGFGALLVAILWLAMASGANEQQEAEKRKAAEGLDGALVTMGKRDPGATVQSATPPAAEPVTTRDAAPDGRTAAFDPPRADAPLEAVTLGEFNEIANGMSYDQVAYLIGGPGRQTSEINSGAMAIQGYEWQGAKPGSYARAQFQAGRLISKSQSGLE